MSDQAEKWRNVAQAAQWLAEGKAVEHRWAKPKNDEETAWKQVPSGDAMLSCNREYRLKPEPPKPREWGLGWNANVRRWEIMASQPVRPDDVGQVIRVREVIE